MGLGGGRHALPLLRCLADDGSKGSGEGAFPDHALMRAKLGADFAGGGVGAGRRGCIAWSNSERFFSFTH